MKKTVLAMILMVTVLSTLLAQSATCGDEPAVRVEDREAFIRDLQRNDIRSTPEDAMLLRVLVETRNAQRGVEVGSAVGYGAINMGIAFERTGGQLFTLEIEPEMVKACRDNVAKTGLEKTITCIEGDALQTLPALEGEFDFVFLDAVKKDYLKYLKFLEPKLKPGAVIVADNVIQSAEAMKDYLEYIKTGPDYETVIVRASDEKQDGMAITYKIR